MMWWLSSLVFCVTVISKFYTSKTALVDLGLKVPVGVLVSLCFLSMIIFGGLVIKGLSEIEMSLCYLFVDNYTGFTIPSVTPVFSLVTKLYIMITSTLGLFLLIWLYVWFYDKPYFTINKP